MSDQAPGPADQSTAAVGVDRRAYVRLASNLAAICSAPDPGREIGWAGRLRDISLGGIGLLLQHRFRPGTSLTVELRDHTGSPLCTLQARVAHVTAVLEDGNPCWLHGCPFDQPLSEEQFATLTSKEQV